MEHYGFYLPRVTVAWGFSCRRPLSYRNQSIDLQSKANQWTGFYMITASVMNEKDFQKTISQWNIMAFIYRE